MKTSGYFSIVILVMRLFAGASVQAQLASAKETSINKNSNNMKTYVIQRDIPNAGKLTPAELKAISQTSCGVLKEMGSQQIEWIHSYVTGDHIFCIYKATSEAAIREQAKKGGFTANSIMEVANIISPATAN